MDATKRESIGPQNASRRDLLRAAAAVPAALAAAHTAVAGEPAASAPPSPKESPAVDEKTLPQIRLGQHSVSRLICGANCFNGGSHLSVFVNHQMREYYTPEQILKNPAAVPGGGRELLAVGPRQFQSLPPLPR